MRIAALLTIKFDTARVYLRANKNCIEWNLFNVVRKFNLELSHEQPARAHLNMWNGFHKIVHCARIRISALDVVLLPVDVADLTWYVSTHNVVFLDFVQGQMWIVDSNQNNTGIISFVYDDAIVELWHWNLSRTVVDVKMILSWHTADIVQLDDAPCSRIHIQIDATVSGKHSKDLVKKKWKMTNFNRNWIQCCALTSFHPPQPPNSERWIFATRINHKLG